MKIVSMLILIMITLLGCGNNAKVNAKNQTKKVEVEKTESSKVAEVKLKQGIEEGNIIEDFPIYDLEGRKFYISDFKGKIVMLNFWATWCPPCRAEMPSMEELYREGNEDIFEIIAVSVDSKPVGEVKSFISESGYSFPIYYDKNDSLSQKFAVRSIPTTYLIDGKGIIRQKFLGSSDWSKLNVKALSKEWEK